MVPLNLRKSNSPSSIYSDDVFGAAAISLPYWFCVVVVDRVIPLTANRFSTIF